MSFHDWSLETIQVQWVEKKIRIHILGPDGRKGVIECSEFLKVIVPREESWGPSKSIYRITQEATNKDGTGLLKIEMQSGDTILITANHIAMPGVIAIQAR